MSLLESVIGALAGQKPAAGGGDLLSAVIGMVANGSSSGGLGGLIEQFQRGGLGDAMNSWVSNGPNAAVSPADLSHVFGSDVLGSLAQQTGLSNDDLLGQLTQMLPQVVDQLTPQGQVPTGGLGDIGDILARFSQR